MQATLQRTLEPPRHARSTACGDGAPRARSAGAAARPTWCCWTSPCPGWTACRCWSRRARGGLDDAGADPDRARHRGRPRHRPEHRRRRLPAQALRPGRARGAPARAAPPPRPSRRRRRRTRSVGGAALRPRQRRRLLPRPGAGTHAARAGAAAGADGQARPRRDQGAPVRTGVSRARPTCSTRRSRWWSTACARSWRDTGVDADDACAGWATCSRPAHEAGAGRSRCAATCCWASCCRWACSC